MTTETPEQNRRSAAPLAAEVNRARIALRKASAVLAAIAGLGAILGGLTGYWSTYRVVTTDLSAPAAPKLVLSRLSIAVLPFANLSGGTADDYFADGIIDDLTTNLSMYIPGLLAAGRGSAFSYKGKHLSFEPIKDFAAVAPIAIDSNALVINPAVPARTL